MASLCRLTATLLEVTPRKVASASFSRSAVLSSAALVAESFNSPAVPQIFDIFDAPVKLRERRTTTDDQFKALSFLSTSRATSRAGPSNSRSLYSDALGLPRSLPPPITFDGPACPPHMSTSALKKRHQQRQNLTHSSRRHHGSSAVSFKAFTSQSEPVYQMFDGPSRITRYPYPSLQNDRSYLTYVALAICLSSGLGWFTLKDRLHQNKARST